MSARDACGRARSRRSSRPEKTSSLLDPLIKRLGIAGGVQLSRIQSDWDDAFEKPLSLHMWPSRVSEGRLLLNVDSPIWMHQLSYHKGAILSKLARYGIKEVAFKIGRVSRKTRETPITAIPELSHDERSFIEELASKIDDGELQEAIRGAAERSFREEKKLRKKGEV